MLYFLRARVQLYLPSVLCFAITFLIPGALLFSEYSFEYEDGTYNVLFLFYGYSIFS